MIPNEELALLVSYPEGRKLLSEALILKVPEFPVHILSKITS